MIIYYLIDKFLLTKGNCRNCLWSAEIENSSVCTGIVWCRWSNVLINIFPAQKERRQFCYELRLAGRLEDVLRVILLFDIRSHNSFTPVRIMRLNQHIFQDYLENVK